MADSEPAVIRLDRSKPFSECRGERTPDDPHYRVHFWQGQMVGKDMVLLPFDACDELIPEDPTKSVPYQGLVDGKPVMHQPLYNQAMRDLVERKKKRHQLLSPAAAPTENDEEDAGSDAMLDEVNFAMWLRGEARYDWTLLQTAAKKRFSRHFTSKKQMVEDLVLDEKVVPENQVSADLAKLLPTKQAA